MDAEERLRIALAQKLRRDLHTTGYADIFDDAIAELGREVSISEHLIEHVIRQLTNEGLLYEMSHGYFDGVELSRVTGRSSPPRSGAPGTPSAGRSFAQPSPATKTGAGGAGSTSRRRSASRRSTSRSRRSPRRPGSWSRGYVQLEQASGRAHYVALTHAGYDLARDEEALRQAFPRNASEDEHAHTAVVPDVVSELVTSVEQALRARGWTSALDELAGPRRRALR